jgi:hypothetical protein
MRFDFDALRRWFLRDRLHTDMVYKYRQNATASYRRRVRYMFPSNKMPLTALAFRPRELFDAMIFLYTHIIDDDAEARTISQRVKTTRTTAYSDCTKMKTQHRRKERRKSRLAKRAYKKSATLAHENTAFRYLIDDLVNRDCIEYTRLR